MQNAQLKYYLRIGGTLLIISACIAVMLGVINFFTADIIAENKAEELNKSIKNIFSDLTNIEEMNLETNNSIKQIYSIYKDDSQLGYCVYLESSGFNGAVEILVGTDMNGVVTGVEIISHSETPGLGSKADNKEYLTNYIGKSKKVTLNSDIDAIAGATITSKAILTGVNTALSLSELYENGGA